MCWDVLSLEYNQYQGGKMVVSLQPVTDYFPITVHSIVFYLVDLYPPGSLPRLHHHMLGLLV